MTSARSWGARGLVLARLCAIVLILTSRAGPASQANPSLNHRFGLGVSSHPIESYGLDQLAQLRAGAYTRWQTFASPARPLGMEYIQGVRVKQRKDSPQYDASYTVPYTYTISPTWDTLRDHVRANPGALWFIGNEIERVDWPTGHQDECLPEVYAEVYHEAYTRIKGWDPTAQVAIGAVCQVTPLRLEYLDRVLAAYRARYGTQMPVDVWNIHSYVLRERRYYDGCPDCWGIDVPAGSSAAAGRLYDIRDSDNLSVFKEQVTTFRRWMRDHGERDKPLMLSEVGVLMPYWVEDEDGRTFTPERVRDFMYGAFDYVQTATDPDLGCPADKDRLVQRWVWFSLDADPEVFGGGLFDPATRQMTPLGRYWAAYVHDPARMPAPHVNLFPVRAWADAAPGGANLGARIGNSGSQPLAQSFVVRFEDEAGQTLGEVVVAGLRCCGDSVAVSVPWPNAPPGEHRVRVRVDPAGHVAEADRGDNELIAPVRVGDSAPSAPSPTVTPSPTAATASPSPALGQVVSTPAPTKPPSPTAATASLPPAPSAAPTGASQATASLDHAAGCLGVLGILALSALAGGVFLYRRDRQKKGG